MDGQFIASQLVKELFSNYSIRLDVAQLSIVVMYGSVGLINVFNGVEIGNSSSLAGSAHTSSCGLPGTALTWAPSSWSFPGNWPLSTANKNNFIKKVAVSDVCRSNGNTSRGVLVIMPFYLTVTAAYGVCSRLGNSGQIPIYDNLMDWQAAWNFAVTAIAASTTVKLLWQPFHRHATMDIFVSWYNTSHQLNSSMWIDGQPNSLDQKCVLCDKQGCWDRYCNEEQLFSCQFPVNTPPLLRLRGLCPQTSLDTMYYPTNRLGDLALVGMGTNKGVAATYIRFEHEAQHWEARMSGSKTWAVSDASYESLLLGTQKWTIFYDRKCFPGSKLMDRCCTGSQQFIYDIYFNSLW
jgi:hypothetical protein